MPTTSRAFSSISSGASPRTAGCRARRPLSRRTTGRRSSPRCRRCSRGNAAAGLRNSGAACRRASCRAANTSGGSRSCSRRSVFQPPAAQPSELVASTHSATGDAAEQVLLKDALEPLRRDVRIPDALRVNDEQRPRVAHAETAGLRAHRREAGLLHAALHVFPSRLAVRGRAAVGPEAEEEMALRDLHAGLRETGGELRVHDGSDSCKTAQLGAKNDARVGPCPEFARRRRQFSLRCRARLSLRIGEEAPPPFSCTRVARRRSSSGGASLAWKPLARQTLKELEAAPVRRGSPRAALYTRDKNWRWIHAPRQALRSTHSLFHRIAAGLPIYQRMHSACRLCGRG